MNKTTTPGVTISKVERTHASWLYLWPFQSCRELLRLLVVLAVGMPIVGAMVYLLDPAGLWPLLLGATSGYLLCIVNPMLPARLTLSTRSEARYHLANLQAMLLKLGYVAKELEAPLAPGRFLYRSKKSKFWRWDEQDMQLAMHEHELVLNGPVAVLGLLRARLLLLEDYACLNKV